MQQRRWVSYIFRYRDYERCEIAGFIKVQRISSKEADVTRIRMGLRMYKPYPCECTAYLLLHGRAKPFASINFAAKERDSILTSVELPWNNPLGDGKPFTEYEGVFFMCDDGERLAGIWEEEPYDIRQVKLPGEYSSEEEAEEIPETDWQRDETKIENPEKMTEQVYRSSQPEQNAGLSANIAQFDEPRVQTPTAQPEPEEPRVQTPTARPEEQIVQATTPESSIRQEEIPEAIPESISEPKLQIVEIKAVEPETQKQTDEKDQRSSGNTDSESVSDIPSISGEEASGKDVCGCQEMLSTYPKLPLFAGSQILDGVKIVPQDIGKLDMANWKLGVNSFLSHGYYKYQYLMLGKVRMNKTECYVIGVPGVFTNKERYLANMFGFRVFIPVKKTKIMTGNFGYWVSEVISKN